MKKQLVAFGLVMTSTLLSACGGSATYSYTLTEKEKKFHEPSSNVVTLDDSVTQFHFLNVNRLDDYAGSADSILILDEGKVTLIDSGMETEDTKKAVSSYLNALGVTRIDNLILTHSHNDHGGSMEWMIYYYDIGRLYIKGTDYDTKVLGGGKEWKDIYTRVKNAASRKVNSDGSYASVVEVMELGYTIPVTEDSQMNLYFSPTVYEDGAEWDYNHFSMTIKYTCDEVSAYLAGDATDMIDRAVLGTIGECQLLKVAHHGTNGPYNSVELLQEMLPRYAVITTTASAVSSEMKQKLQNINCPYDCTGEGAIVYETDGKAFRKI